MARSYPAEFRRKVLDLIEAGRPVAEVAQQLGVTGQTIYNWRNQDLVDRGLRPGVSTAESVELAAARKRIRELETELAVTKRAFELLKEQTDPKALRGRRRGRSRRLPRRGRLPCGGGVGVGLLLLETASAVGAFGAPLDAAGGHRRDPPGLSTHLWSAAHPCRVGSRARSAGGALHRGAGHAPQQPHRAARPAPIPQGVQSSHRRRSR